MGSRTTTGVLAAAIVALLVALGVWLAGGADPDGHVRSGPGPGELVVAPEREAHLERVGDAAPAAPLAVPTPAVEAPDGEGRAGVDAEEPTGAERLEVRVSDLEGAPVVGARVRRLDPERVTVAGTRVVRNDPSGDRALLGVTDAAGLLVLRRSDVVDPRGDAAMLLISHPRHAPARRGVQPGKRRVRVRLSPGHALRVFVESSAGGGVPGAEVSAWMERAKSWSATLVAEGRADERGVCLLEGLPPGRVTLSVGAAGHQRQVRELPVGEEAASDVVVELPRGRSLDVLVFDEDDRPVPGATVHGFDGATGWGQHVTTDDEGHAFLDRLPAPPATVAVSVRHDDFVQRPQTNLGVDALAALGGKLVVGLERGAALRVVFEGVPSAAPCADVAVSATVDGTGPFGMPARVAGAEARGWEPLELRAVPAGEEVVVGVQAMGRTFLREGVTLAPGETRELRCPLPPAADVSIVVLRGGEPWPTGTLGLRAADGRSMPAPRRAASSTSEVPVAVQVSVADARALCLEPGRYDVIHRDEGTTTTVRDVLVEAGAEVVVELGDERIVGRLIDGLGQPLAGEVVMLEAAGRQRALTDAEGRFALRAHQAERSTLSVLDGIAGVVQLLSDVPPSGDLGDLELARFPVRGQVRDVGTGAGESATLYVERRVTGFGGHTGSESLVLGADGRFEFALPAGTWKLRGWKAGWRGEVGLVELGSDAVTREVDVWIYRPAVLTFVAPELPDARFTLTLDALLPGGPWTRSLRFAPGQPPGPWDTGDDESGTLRADVPPGALTVIAECDEAPPRALELTTVSGQELVVDVSAPP